MNTPVLETPRLILRPMRLEDAPAIQKYFGTWDIIQFMRTCTVPWPYPSDGASQWLQEKALPQMEKGSVRLWGLLPKEDPQEVIGALEVRPADPEDNRGFWLAAPFQGRGLVTEAVRAAHQYVFGRLGLERLLVINARNNIASRRVKEKTGARFLHLRPDRYHNGCMESEVWEVRREDWLKASGKTIAAA